MADLTGEEGTDMNNDHSAIKRLLYAYADAVLTHDADAWGSTWTDDAVWELGPGREVHGKDAIVGLWIDAIAKYEHVVQLYQSSEATIDGDTACGRAYLVELNVPVDGPPRTMAGYYSDEYARTVDGWKFTSRRLRVLYSGPADLSGRFFTRD